MGKFRFSSNTVKQESPVLEKQSEDAVVLSEPIEIIKEVPVEVEKIVYVDRVTEKPFETTIEKIVEVEKLVEVEKIVYVDKPIEVIKEIEKIIEIPVEKTVEVDKIVEVEKLIQVDKEVKVLPKWAKTIITVESVVLLLLIIRELIWHV